MKNNALVIGAGQWQVPLIKYLKDRGSEVVVVDPYSNSPGVEIADSHLKFDVRDSKTILNKINGCNFDLVCSDQSDIAVNTVSIIAENLNLSGNKFKTTNCFVNKVKMRGMCHAAGLNAPVSEKISTLVELDDFRQKTKNTIIIKPADSQSSRGIYKLSYQEVITEEDFQKSLSYSQCGYLIVEEFIVGTEYTVEAYHTGGKTTFLGYSQKEHFRTGIASRLLFQNRIENNLQEELETQVKRFVIQSELNFGFLHAEFIVSEETGIPYLIEIACRGGGTLISSHIAAWLSGVETYNVFYKDLIQSINTDTNIVKIDEYRCAVLGFFEFPKGKVKKIEGVEDAKEIQGVYDINLGFSIGDVIKDAEDDRSRQGYYIILEDNLLRMIEKEALIKALIKIQYE